MSRLSCLVLPFQLALWGWLMLWSSLSGRLSLLLNAVFHPVVVITGVLLLAFAVALLVPLGRGSSRTRRRPQTLVWHWPLTAVVALVVLISPPTPSFSDLASTRPSVVPEGPSLAFYLPPEQRTLTEWVRLLRSQPDPALHEGAPVRISGFVLERRGEPPQIARLLVRCCLADATPAGLDVAWPKGAVPKANQWLRIEGVITTQRRDGRQRVLVRPNRIVPISRPARPLEA